MRTMVGVCLQIFWSYAPVIERLVWYGGADVSWCLSDVIQLRKLWNIPNLRRSLVEGIVTTQGYTHLMDVVGIEDPSKYIYTTYSASSPIVYPLYLLSSNISLTSIVLCLHPTPKLVTAILQHLDLDLYSVNRDIRRISRCIYILGQRTSLSPGPHLIRWFIDNVDYNVYVRYMLELDVHTYLYGRIYPCVDDRLVRNIIEYLRHKCNISRYLLSNDLIHTDDKYISMISDSIRASLRTYLLNWGKSILIRIKRTITPDEDSILYTHITEVLDIHSTNTTIYDNNTQDYYRSELYNPSAWYECMN